MAVRFAELKYSILVILYDYMLTSNHEGFWFSVPSIQEGLPPEVSGAFVQRALDALISEKMVEQGGSNALLKDLFALTEHGIAAAEEHIEKQGVKVEDYDPAPDADLILTRLHSPDKFNAIEGGLDELKKEIAKSNSFKSEAEESSDLIQAEVEAATTLLSIGQVRVSRLKALLLPALRYLAKKFADQAIGEAAKKLIALLIGLEL